MKHLVYYVQGRLFEWAGSISCILLSLALTLFPSADYTLPAIPIFLLGAAGMTALILNGNSLEIGPRARSICAGGRSFLWVHLGLASSKFFGGPSPAGVIFLVLCLSEFYVVYSAVLDVRSK